MHFTLPKLPGETQRLLSDMEALQSLLASGPASPRELATASQASLARVLNLLGEMRARGLVRVAKRDGPVSYELGMSASQARVDKGEDEYHHDQVDREPPRHRLHCHSRAFR